MGQRRLVTPQFSARALRQLEDCTPTARSPRQKYLPLLPMCFPIVILGSADEMTFVQAIDFNGAPGEIRTPDPQIRSLVLYPAELRARKA